MSTVTLPNDLRGRFLTVGKAAQIVGCTSASIMRMARNSGLHLFQLPISGFHRVDGRSLYRLLQESRHEDGLRKMGWEPVCLGISCEPSWLALLRDELAALSEDIRVVPAEDAYEAGFLCSQLDPCCVLVDFCMGRQESLDTLKALKYLRPWVRLIGLDHGGSWEEQEEVQKACDVSVLAPFSPKEVADVIRWRM